MDIVPSFPSPPHSPPPCGCRFLAPLAGHSAAGGCAVYHARGVLHRSCAPSATHVDLSTGLFVWLFQLICPLSPSPSLSSVASCAASCFLHKRCLHPSLCHPLALSLCPSPLRSSIARRPPFLGFLLLSLSLLPSSVAAGASPPRPTLAAAPFWPQGPEGQRYERKRGKARREIKPSSSLLPVSSFSSLLFSSAVSVSVSAVLPAPLSPARCTCPLPRKPNAEGALCCPAPARCISGKPAQCRHRHSSSPSRCVPPPPR